MTDRTTIARVASMARAKGAENISFDFDQLETIKKDSQDASLQHSTNAYAFSFLFIVRLALSGAFHAARRDGNALQGAGHHHHRCVCHLRDLRRTEGRQNPASPSSFSSPHKCNFRPYIPRRPGSHFFANYIGSWKEFWARNLKTSVLGSPVVVVVVAVVVEYGARERARVYEAK